MIKKIVQQSAAQFVGIQVRTNNKTEMNPATAKIAGCYQRYFGEGIAGKIPNRKNPGVTRSIYSDYASDANGDYNFFIGEEVSDLNQIPAGLVSCETPTQKYAKLTVGPGPMPQVVIGAWQDIWKMSDHELGGERSFKADFEVYDERAADPQHAVLDIYLGLKS